MALHLITGYAGREHITSADQGAYNAATFGGGEFVLDRGRKFEHTVLSNNAISIADGEAMMQGRYIKMPSGTSESVTIDNGTQGNKRNDLICIRYSKDPSTSVESASLVVIKGTSTTGTPTDPAYTSGDITDGTDNVADFPLYRVSLDGININSVTSLFNIKTSMVDYMENYQLKVASVNELGGFKKPGSGGLPGYEINADGVLRASIRYESFIMRSMETVTLPMGWSQHNVNIIFPYNEVYDRNAENFSDVIWHAYGAIKDGEYLYLDNVFCFVQQGYRSGNAFGTDRAQTFTVKFAVYNNTGQAISNVKLCAYTDFRLTRFK